MSRILTYSIAAFLCLACQSLYAFDRFLIDSTAGLFSDTNNWSTTDGGPPPASVPAAADIANFTLNSTYTVTFSSGPTNTDLDVENGTVTFDLNGFAYTLM